MNHAFQPSFDDLGTHLADATFVVVDLETTGTSDDCAITEIGAVKVSGGKVLGEFQTLVKPPVKIPAVAAVISGITDQMVADAPPIEAVLPLFLSFMNDCVLVAHNARFDVGFLRRACHAHGYAWPSPVVLDTVALARNVLPKDEVPNVKLGTLAAHFGASVEPNHRALSDARATVDVLHCLLERVSNRGVHTIDDVQEFLRAVSPQRRAKKSWAKDLPTRPGIYWFEAEHLAERNVLYVGKSKNLRSRVSTYFTASETRPRMDEMVRVATSVKFIECATDLEAEIRELRMIAAHVPRYNRRSKFPQRTQWLKITTDHFPRLSLVRTVRDDGAAYFGPLSQRTVAEDVQLCLYEAFSIRQCSKKLSTTKVSSSCALADLGRCAAPCLLTETHSRYTEIVDHVHQALFCDVRPVLQASQAKLQRLVAQERFEEASAVSQRLKNYANAVLRHHRFVSVARLPLAVAARRCTQGWEIHVFKYGRLAAAALARPSQDPLATAQRAMSGAETVLSPTFPQSAALVEETERIASWLELPGVRFIELDGDWTWPLHIGLAEGELTLHALGQNPSD